MPLFRNHHTVDVNGLSVPCPEPTCTRILPAPCKCQSSVNPGKWYTACSNKAHCYRYKFWDLGIIPNGLPAPAQPPAAPAPWISALHAACNRAASRTHNINNTALDRSTYECTNTALDRANYYHTASCPHNIDATLNGATY
ncbi:hypothetical protein DFH08DRAFT_957916 [Mycena albidolilacea]|uniref:Uncharacterized protein n=1 Tax=Mycena albidolilacea TaxID=1033008 RepID=A0AAD7A928_9AGAR|nr:hypothetical protein DFH08DRAFT_957916 [Mycena albidolilacea]